MVKDNYPVPNGIRVAVTLKKTSHLTMAGNRVLISYENQPTTCYGFNETGHQYHECPKHQQINTQNIHSQASWAEVVTQRTITNRIDAKQTTKQTLPPSDPKEAPFDTTRTKPPLHIQ